MMKTEQKFFRILYTSDIHGRLFAEAGEAGLDETGRGFCKDGNTLIFDGGDLLQGGPAGTFFVRETNAGNGGRDHPAAALLNRCGYDAVIPGNHDFNYGIPYFADYLSSLKGCCLCANIHDHKGLLPVADSRVFVLENGLRVGVFGLCTDALAGWEREETVRELSIEAPLTAARRALEGLRGNCDVTVCIYHGGFEEDPDTGEVYDDSGENAAVRLCREFHIDLLLTGHQHLREPGRWIYGTYAVQPGCFGRCYAEITGTVTGGAVEFSSRLVEAAILDPTSGRASGCPGLEQWKSSLVCRLPAPISIGGRVEMALYGSELADFINRVQLSVTGAQISATCLSNTALGLPEEVRIADVFRAYTSANTLCVVRCSGDILRRALEWTAEFMNFENGVYRIDRRFLLPKPRYFHYDFYAGLDYQIDFTRPAGSRVIRLRFNGKDVGFDDSFTLCITNYRRAGGDGYGMFRSCPLLLADPTPVAEYIIGYLQNRPTGGCFREP